MQRLKSKVGRGSKTSLEVKLFWPTPFDNISIGKLLKEDYKNLEIKRSESCST